MPPASLSTLAVINPGPRMDRTKMRRASAGRKRATTVSHLWLCCDGNHPLDYSSLIQVCWSVILKRVISLARWHQLYQDQPSNKAAHVGPKGNAASGVGSVRNRRGSSAQKLQHKPVAQYQPCRQPEHEKPKPGENAGARIEIKISTHDPGNSSAGANAGNLGM